MTRQKIFWFLAFKVWKAREGELMCVALRIIYFFLFPVKVIVQKTKPFDWQTQTWNFHGVKISDKLFMQMIHSDDWFRIVENDYGIITFETKKGAP